MAAAQKKHVEGFRLGGGFEPDDLARAEDEVAF